MRVCSPSWLNSLCIPGRYFIEVGVSLVCFGIAYGGMSYRSPEVMWMGLVIGSAFLVLACVTASQEAGA